MTNRLLKIAFFLTMLSHIQLLHAYKTDMHVAIGLNILDQIRSKDTVFISGYDREVPVESRALRALRTHPGAFLAGTVGPDFYPDLLIGQSIIHPGVESGWKTRDFLNKLLSGASNDREYAFALGNYVHAASDVFAHSYVNTFSGDQFDIFDGEIHSELRHIYLESYISESLLSKAMKRRVASIYPTHEDIPIDFIVDVYFDDPDVLNEYHGASVSHIKYIKDYENKITRFRRKINNIRNPLANKIMALKGEIDRLNGLGYDLAKYSYKLQSKLVCHDKVDKVCKNEVKFLGGVVTCLSYENVVKEICEKNDELFDALEEFNQFSTDLATASTIFGPIEVLYQSLVDLEISIDKAKVELVKVSHKSAVSSIEGQPGKIEDHYKDWLACYGLIFGGVPHQITENITCTGYSAYKTFKDAYYQVEKLLGPAQYGIIGNHTKELLEKEISNYLEEKLMDVADEILGDEVLDIYQALSQNPSKELLKQTFSFDNTNKRLLIIDNIIERVNSDLGGKNISIESFPPTYNAVQLSKMVIIDSNRINRMIKEMGGDANFSRNEKVLTKELDTIDSNHQWLKLSPPLPRERFDYLDFDKTVSPGMKLYYNMDGTQSPVFKRLFKGPLVPSIETPNARGFESLLPREYPYKVCSGNPYPNGSGDNMCSIITLIPIFTGLIKN